MNTSVSSVRSAGSGSGALGAEYKTTPNAIYRLKNRMTAKIREAWLAAAGPDGDLADALEALAKELV